MSLNDSFRSWTKNLRHGRSLGSRIARSMASSLRKTAHQPLGRGGVVARVEQLEERTLLTAITVTSTLDTIDPNDGVTTLREAVIAANNSPGDDTITLPAGTYTLGIAGAGENAAATGDLDITDTTGSLTIIGAGAETTIIDAGGATGLNDRVFEVLSGVVVNVSGVTVTGGSLGGFANFGTLTLTNNTVSNNLGRGIYNAGVLTLRNSTLSGNTTTGNGGGIYNSGGHLSIIDSSILSNTSSRTGGGGINSAGVSTVTISGSFIQGNEGGALRSGSRAVWNITDTTISGNSGVWSGGFSGAGDLTISDSTISDNTGGGAAIALNGPLTLVNSSIIRNTGISSGGLAMGGSGNIWTISGSTISNNVGTQSGGLFLSNGVVSIIDSFIEDNIATEFGGGGIRNSGSDLTLMNTVISGNDAPSGAAILSKNDATLMVVDSTIVDNLSSNRTIILEGGTNTFVRSSIADNAGGGIWSSGSIGTLLTVIDSTISGNASGTGAISASGGVILTVENSTLTGNIRGIRVLGAATINNSTITNNLNDGIQHVFTDPVEVKNSIIAGNAKDLSGVFNSLGHNLIRDIRTATGFTDGVNGDQVGGAGNAIIDPLLGSLQDNDGPTFTQALLPTSPAIDAGSSTDPSGAPVTADQRGITRPQGVANDIGAFEVQVLNLPPVSDAGGPYAVEEGSVIQLDVSGTTDPDLPNDNLTYAWDLDGDGLFGETGTDAARGDETGIAPTFSSSLRKNQTGNSQPVF